MNAFKDSIINIKGIGEKKALALNKLGVFSVYDLLSYFPRRYEDRSEYLTLFDVPDGESASLRLTVADEPRLLRIRRGMEIVRFHAFDDTASVEISFFNQNYVKNQLHRGDSILVYGKVTYLNNRRTMANPVFEREEAQKGLTGGIVPVYRLNAGINRSALVGAIRQAVDLYADSIPELIPGSVRKEYGLVSSGFAFRNLHAPADYESLEAARHKMIFEELFVLACALDRMRCERVYESGIAVERQDIERFYSSLSFSPTGAQRRAVEQSIADLHSGKIMNRLVQGDVGSGKTLVAAALVWYMAQGGWCSAFMAPTDILARQHFDTLSRFLGSFGIRIGLLTGSLPAREKRLVKEQLKNGELDLIIGTHALFSEDVEYSRLGLVVTDEQHRFGVAQRSALIGKGLKPHVLVMSATPIPRTLALIIYGDLDVSIIDELPPGRKAVDTFHVNESYRERLNRFIRKLTAEGRQVFVVCPKVEESEDEAQNHDLKSAEEHAKTLAAEFPELKVSCIHGKMKPKDKDSIMAAFLARESSILVSTTVIEVGVDVPNASLIIIENAERFGLSQLHQLRGRVGRGEHKSYCILVSDKDNEEVRQRLGVICKTSDGFKISEEDLRMRGPGDFFGSRQHGLPEMHLADLGADVKLLQEAQSAAEKLLRSDPQLSLEEHAPLKERIAALFETNSDSFN